MKTAQNIDPNSLNKIVAGSTKAEKIQELSELLDELFSIKAKLNKTGDAKNDGKQ
ncbi:MAG: hypothetical protein M1529_01910 [Candidatus Thermoplasmatota archaeon]|jgi:hypothetical protein|nr:hypothetical protein [Candidatus Thermoplasmatota archaeon]